MSPDWRLIIDGKRSGREHMNHDTQLAAEAMPTLRLFCWEPPAISLGYKQPAPAWLEHSPWRQSGLECVERPTGGGIAFHGSDLSFGVVVPRVWGLPIESQMHAVCEATVRLCQVYGAEAAVNPAPRALARGFGEPSFGDSSSSPHSSVGLPWGGVKCETRSSRVTYCLAEPAPYSVFVNGRKIAGFALRRYPESWLIQGSLLVHPLPPTMMQAMPQEVVERLHQHAVALSDVASCGTPQEVAQRFASSWAVWWEGALLATLGAACS